jgi:hypothetical protein
MIHKTFGSYLLINLQLFYSPWEEFCCNSVKLYCSALTVTHKLHQYYLFHFNYLSIYLSVCLFVCLSVCLSACLPVCLSVYLSTHPPTYLPTYIFLCIPTYLPTCLRVSVYLPSHLSTCQLFLDSGTTK